MEKRSKRVLSKDAAPSASHEAWLVERLKSPKAAAAYLEAAIEDGNQGGLMLALRHVTSRRHRAALPSLPSAQA